MLAVILIPATVAVLMLIAFQVGDWQSHSRSYSEGFDEGYHQAWLDASEVDRNLAAGIEKELSGRRVQPPPAPIYSAPFDANGVAVINIPGAGQIHDVGEDTAWGRP